MFDRIRQLWGDFWSTIGVLQSTRFKYAVLGSLGVLFILLVVIAYQTWRLAGLISDAKSEHNAEEIETLRTLTTILKEIEIRLEKTAAVIGHSMEVLLQETRGALFHLASEADNLQLEVQRLFNINEDLKGTGGYQNSRSQVECNERVEEQRLKLKISCDTDIKKLQQESSDQMEVMKTQVKLQLEQIQELGRVLSLLRQNWAQKTSENIELFREVQLAIKEGRANFSDDSDEKNAGRFWTDQN